jgi:hypothetical protein
LNQQGQQPFEEQPIDKKHYEDLRSQLNQRLNEKKSQKFFNDAMVQRFFHGNQAGDFGSANKNSAMPNTQSHKDMQDYVNQMHKLNSGKTLIPIILGEHIYNSSFFDRLFKRKE